MPSLVGLQLFDDFDDTVYHAVLKTFPAPSRQLERLHLCSSSWIDAARVFDIGLKFARLKWLAFHNDDELKPLTKWNLEARNFVSISESASPVTCPWLTIQTPRRR